MMQSVLAVLQRTKWPTVFSTAVALLGASAFGQSSTAIGMTAGNTAGALASMVALRKLKEAKASVSLGPKLLEFNAVRLGKSWLNIATFTNGTNSEIKIESLNPSSGFRLASTVTVPFVIPPQTEALLTLEFLPSGVGTQTGTMEVRYRTSGGASVQIMKIKLRGKGVQQ